MQTMDESHMEAQQMSQDEEDHESESVRSDATTEENDDDEGRIIIFVIYGRLLKYMQSNLFTMYELSCF